MINKKRLVKLLQDIIKIDTCNPPGNEYKLARFLKSYLSKYGIKSKIIEFYPRRSNILFRLKSKKRKKTLACLLHLDTVPVEEDWKHSPFGGRIEKDKIFGRGATDCKGNIAACIEALLCLKGSHSLENLDIVFCATSDEEMGSHKGLIPLLKSKKLNADMSLVLDSENFEIIVSQKGLLHIEVEILGKSAHASVPQKGINAIYKSSQIINDIYNLKFKYKPISFLKPPTVNVGTIQGGVKTNIVAPTCKFTLDVRYLPDMNYLKIIKDIKAIISKYSKRYNLKIVDHQKPIMINSQDKYLKGLIKAVKMNNMKPKLRGSEGATVMSILKDYGFASFAFGFGEKFKSHTKDEYIKITSLIKGARILYDYFLLLDKNI